MIRPIGFSTGAVAFGDFRSALAAIQKTEATAVELSALRLSELGPLVLGLPDLDLSRFVHVSVHAPSRFDPSDEASVVDALSVFAARGYPVIVHPDAIVDHAAWRTLGAAVSIENMDVRKPVGRTLSELARFFKSLPEATFCLDIGHAHQVDRTMEEARRLIGELGPRLVQLHVSEVDAESRHQPLGPEAASAFHEVARWVPDQAPLILETPIAQHDMAEQLRLASSALSATEVGRSRPWQTRVVTSQKVVARPCRF